MPQMGKRMQTPLGDLAHVAHLWQVARGSEAKHQLAMLLNTTGSSVGGRRASTGYVLQVKVGSQPWRVVDPATRSKGWWRCAALTSAEALLAVAACAS